MKFLVKLCVLSCVSLASTTVDASLECLSPSSSRCVPPISSSTSPTFTSVRGGSTTTSSNGGIGKKIVICNVLTKSIPALSVGRTNKDADCRKTVEVSTKVEKKRSLPSLKQIPMVPHVGVYYGITVEKVFDENYYAPKQPKPKRVTLADTMTETLIELRTVREELQALREEMKEMKQKLTGEEDGFVGGLAAGENDEISLAARAKRVREFKEIGREVEQWGRKILFQEEREGNGWVEVSCTGLARRSFNREGKTKAYIKWMTDPRGKHADTTDEREYPCIKMYSQIDAPLEEVCAYLSQPKHLEEYNDLVVDNHEIEEITPHSKVTWGKTPQILFVKSRDFVTFCSHRFLKDGSQVVVNQACEHAKYPPCHNDQGNKICRAYALRGVNFIMRDPDDPEKTQMGLIAQCNPGGGLPQWAVKTVIKALAPIEPFKLFHKINANVVHKRPQLQERLEQIEMVSVKNGTPKGRPAGLSQLGYACFWPEGATPSRPQQPQLEREQSSSSTPTAEQEAGHYDTDNTHIMASSPIEIITTTTTTEGQQTQTAQLAH